MAEVRLIPGVRKVSMSPWVNGERGAAAIGSDYVYSRKPNPAFLAWDPFDPKRCAATCGPPGPSARSTGVPGIHPQGRQHGAVRAGTAVHLARVAMEVARDSHRPMSASAEGHAQTVGAALTSTGHELLGQRQQRVFPLGMDVESTHGVPGLIGGEVGRWRELCRQPKEA